MVVSFKFRGDAGDRERHEVLDALPGHGARRVDPLAPGTADPELSRLYLAEAGSEDDAERILGYLSSAPAIEFAERPPTRGLR